jgi:anti-sigma B factor antagonist
MRVGHGFLPSNGAATSFSVSKTLSFVSNHRLGSSSNMASPRRLQINESANISVVRFKDQKIIDPVAIQELGQELFDLIEKDDRRKIVLNFDNVEFLSSAALGKLITFEKKAKRTGAEMILTNISPEIYQVFAITNLDKLFKIKDSEADALAVL